MEPLRQEDEEEIRFTRRAIPLALGTPASEDLKGGEGHQYELRMEAGQFAHLVVQQQGADVAVLVQKPGRDSRGKVDSPNGSDGPEIVYLLAEETGVYGIEVVCEDFAAPAGRYEVRVEEIRPAQPEDRALFEAWKLFRKGEAARQGERFREAVGLYEQALPAWRALGRRDWEAETLHRIGRVQSELGQYPAALEAFQAALPWFREHGPRAYEGEILNRVGRLLFSQGDFESAVRHDEEARDLFREIGREDLEAEALYNLGVLWNARGEAEKALELFTQARDLAHSASDFQTEAFALRGLGEVYLFLGRFDPALDALRQALRLQEAGAQGDRAVTLRSLASLHVRRKEPEAARRCLDEALALERARENRDGEALLLNIQGTLALEREKPKEAKAAFERALTLSRGTGNRHGEAFALLNLGRALYDDGDVAGALRFHEEAAVLFEALQHRRGLVSTLYGSARALNALDRSAEARERLIRVGNDTELLRSSAESLDLRSTFFATKQHYFDLYVDVLMNLHLQDREAGYDHLALEVNERRRARSLLEELGGRGKIRSDADPKLLSRRRELEASVEETERELVAVRGGDQGRVEALEERLRSLLGELERVRTALRQDERRRSGQAEPRPLGFKGMQELLDADSLLLVFSLGKERSYLWCVANRGRLVSRPLPGRSWIEERVEKLGRSWSRRDRSGPREERLEEELSRDLLGPVAKLLGTRRLVIVADGALQGLSFAALPDPAAPEGEPAPLLARHEIVYLPSASVLAILRQELQSRPRAPGRLIVLADPVFGPDDPRVGERVPTIARPEPDPDLGRAAGDLNIDLLRPLPFSAQEAEAIRGLYPEGQIRVLSGFAADLSAVRENALRPYSIVHFATHGLVHPQHPELSGLVLSRVDENGVQRPGHLRAHQIADLDLRAELVVLSACETGVGTELRGEGTQALTRSFMRASVPRLVVSLWAVSDAGTAELMERFYRGMLKHQLSPSEALRCAQLSMLGEKRWSDPFYWAPFVFQGEWEKRVGKPPISDDSIERQSGGAMPPIIPDDDFPPPGDEPPRKCPDLRKEGA